MIRQLQTQVESIMDDARQRLTELAEKFRTERLIPLCRKHKLEFISGMGTTAFYKQNGKSISDARFCDADGFPYLKDIFEVLNIEVAHNDVFGFYVGDVRKSDWKGE